MILLRIMTILMLLLSTACSKEKSPPESAATEETKTEAITVYSATKALYTSKENAQKGLEESKQVNQIIQDSAAQRQETIEKTQQ